MNSIMKHDYGRLSQQNNELKNLNNIQVYSPKYSQYNQQKSKHTVQQLYRNQLDQLLQQKQRLKKQQKQRIQKQKQQYRQNAKMGQQNQKMKNIAYKNYYKMLMQGQSINNQNYISPYQQRDKMKSQLINSSIMSQQKRAISFQQQIRLRELQKRNLYKDQLMRQIQQRKQIQKSRRQNQNQQNQYIKQYNQMTKDIQNYDKERKREGMEMYKNQLDKLREEKLEKLSQSRKNTQTQPRIKINDDYHNPLINPLPYNIQNPYILKELEKSRSVNINGLKAETPGLYDYNSNINYERLASREKYNSQNTNQYQPQHNYFARQGYEMMK